MEYKVAPPGYESQDCAMKMIKLKGPTVMGVTRKRIYCH